MTPPKPDEIEAALSAAPAVPQEPIAGDAAGAPVVAPAPRVAQPPPQTGAEATGEIGAAPTLATVSPEASLAPLWPTPSPTGSSCA